MSFDEVALMVWEMWPKGNNPYESGYSDEDVATTLSGLRNDPSKMTCAKYNLIELLTCLAKKKAFDVEMGLEVVNVATTWTSIVTTLVKGGVLIDEWS